MAQELMNKQSNGNVAIAERTRQSVTYTPRFDIVETDGDLRLYGDLPGVCKDRLDIRFENRLLEIRGKVESRHTEHQFVYGEYGIGDFYRSFTISEDIDTEKISAELNNGVLTLHLPKTVPVQMATPAAHRMTRRASPSARQQSESQILHRIEMEHSLEPDHQGEDAGQQLPAQGAIVVAEALLRDREPFQRNRQEEERPRVLRRGKRIPPAARPSSPRSIPLPGPLPVRPPTFRPPLPNSAGHGRAHTSSGSGTKPRSKCGLAKCAR